MTTSQSASRIRQQIAALARQRDRLEEQILSYRLPMLDACLIARHRLAGGKLRKTPAYYLSRKVQGKTQLIYVGRDHLRVVRGQTDRWREFCRAVAQWVKLTMQMEKLFRQLGKRQIVKEKEP